MSQININYAPFQETKKLLRDYVRIEKPLTYERWMLIPEDHKAAALYVNFYNEIELAWYKASSFYGDPCEGVSTVLQYLIKNVPIIEANPARFNAKYIYRVAYNCLYCICHDRKCDKDRYENECSNIVDHDGEELNLFDTVPERTDAVQKIMIKKLNAVIVTLSEDEKVVIEYLMYNEDLPSNFAGDLNQIVNSLRIKLAEFEDLFDL